MNQAVTFREKRKTTRIQGGFAQIGISYELFNLGEPHRTRTCNQLIKSQHNTLKLLNKYGVLALKPCAITGKGCLSLLPM